jgi:uncharacterized protein (TIGR00369 family)
MLKAEIETAVRDSFAAQGAMTALHAELVELDSGRCLLKIERHPGALQQHGYFHGGVIGALADSAAGYAANSILMPSHEVVTAEYKINFLSPATGNVLYAEGRVVRPGRSLVVVTVDVWTALQDKRTDCALAQMTMFAIARREHAVSSQAVYL